MAVESLKPPSPQTETERSRLSVGTVIADRYRIQEVIGEGGMGTVYAAEHLALRKKVAIKVLHLDLLKLPNIVARFEREARATARIEHPNVTNALDFGTLPNGAMYLVLEFVEGRRLRELIAQGPLPIIRALNIGKQVASVLAAAQTLGIVHRDLKPENVILVERDNEPDFVKVLDFGIARMTSSDDDDESQQPLTKLGAVFGTPEYMAPEQALGQRVDSRADLYSLGVILFEMISGVRPYVQSGQSGILSQQITSPRPSFAERAPQLTVPKDVERVVYRLLTKGAQERYQRAADVVTVIEALLANEEPKPTVSSIPAANYSEPLPSFDLVTQLPGLNEPAATAKSSVIERTKAVISVQAKNWGAWTVRVQTEAVALIDRIIDVSSRNLKEPTQQKISRLPRLQQRLLVLSLAVVLLSLPIMLVVLSVRTLSHKAEPRVSTVPSQAVPSVTSSPMIPSVTAAPVALDENSKDPEVLLAIATTRLEAEKDADALNFVIRALSRQVERRNDERVATVLYRTANSVQKDVSDKTIALLQGTMAAKGAELQYQLWLDRSTRESVRKRIDRWLRSEAFDRAASGAISVAVRLRLAESCDKKLAILPTAAKIGGSAALSYLEELQSTTGCGLDGKADCFSCLRADKRLVDAIAQIKARQNTSKR
jgi:serine/threonine-protein kinase